MAAAHRTALHAAQDCARVGVRVRAGASKDQGHPAHGPHMRTDRERGSVTAEFAVALPAVIMVLLLVVGLAMHGADRVTLEDGARAAARELARGSSADVAEQAARATAGDRFTMTTSHHGEYSTVTLSQPVRLVGVMELQADHTAEASARTEHLSVESSGR